MSTNNDSLSQGWPSESPVYIEERNETPPNPKAKKKYARAKLGNAKEIANELSRIYRLMKNGEIDPNLGTKLTYVLQTLAKLRVEGELEDRIAALEQQREVTH